ncbi:multiprotein-bridging factor 1c-like [Telopea speciosissima]|uniref:multiprotein-bridging factor 1c-like n=1 Tax=Telopea speciosissima TaxID=54955 RepID=UPI001CC4AF75|nr:multiprotein-bridging factor 1c-like [Telopea speciosissima]
MNLKKISYRANSIVFHIRFHPLFQPLTSGEKERSVGTEVQTIKKFDAGSNKKPPATAVNARKLDEETELAALNRVAADVRQVIQKARLAKKMSQADLAKQINKKLQLVQEYKNEKAVPNQAVLAKMERVLKVKLRGNSRLGKCK